jgi:hypothetical protein
MFLRIALLVALVAGLAGVGVSHFVVVNKIATLTSERDGSQAKMKAAQDREATAKEQARKATEDLKTINGRLAMISGELAQMTAKAAEQEKRANEKQGALDAAVLERNEAEREISAWRATSINADTVKKLVADLKRVTTDRDMFAHEKALLVRENSKLQNRLSLYEGKDIVKVPMRPGLKGRVVAVDPKWDFVVLDIGSNQGAVERGEMLVNRGGKLIAKVKLTDVQSDRSIANVIPGDQLGEVRETDQVIY